MNQHTWTETVLHNFTGGSDGSYPSGGVIFGRGGVLYGTTQSGGIGGSCLDGCGIAFSLTPPTSPGGAWTETVLHNFTGGSDGANPSAGVVIGENGVLYGTTYNGGTSDLGTVFELKP